MPKIDPIAIRLQDALAKGTLPPDAQQRGHQLFTQLTQPPRIAVIGFSGAGKTGLINMLLGDRLMPAMQGIAATELRFGPTPQVHMDLADGSAHTIDGYADKLRLPSDIVRIVQELPDDRLHDWSFLEIGLGGGGAAEQRDLLEWATRHTDIAIWCSQRFEPLEQALWADVPDHLKDHSFLVLTKADQLYLKGELADQLSRLQPVVADEFLSLFPVATMQAIASRWSGEAGSGSLWHSSGGKAFLSALRQQADQARLADLDQASILLDRCKFADPAPIHAPLTGAFGSRVSKAEQQRNATPASPVERAHGGPAAGEDDAVEQALNLLHQAAGELLHASETPNGASTQRILDRCGEIAGDLVALIASSTNSSAESAFCKDVAAEGEEMLMLLRLERGEDTTADALTVLLQLKKEISERVVP